MSAPAGEAASRAQHDVTVTLFANAIDAHREAQKRIANAREWVSDLSSYDAETLANQDRWREEIADRQRAVDEMELSYLRNFAHMTTMTAGWGGGLRISRDGEACFYWCHESGYAGGLNFHRSRDANVLIGTWSINS